MEDKIYINQSIRLGEIAGKSLVDILAISFAYITAKILTNKQVVPKPNRMKVTGVITPITNQVEICRNNVAARIEAIALLQRIFIKDCSVATNIKVTIVVIKLAGTRNEQIATQLWRENSKIGSKRNIA